MPLNVSTAALQRYEEAVFRVTAEGKFEPANPVATEFAARLSAEDVARLSTAAAKSASANRALVDSRRRYKDFIDISTDFAWEIGPDQRFSFVPPRGTLGYSADALMVLEPTALMVNGSGASEIPFLTRRRIENEEAWLRRSDGRSACMVVSAMPLISKDGTWLGARGVCRDVTETRDREATLTRVRNRERVLTRIVRAFRDEVDPEAMLSVAA